MDGKFLRLQLIYGDKTNQTLPRYQFPGDFSLSVNPKHYSNEKESLKLIDEIVFPYVTEKRQRLLKPYQKALVIFDVFKGQIRDKVSSQYKDSNIEVVFVPANMAGLLQSLDLTANSYPKKYCKSKLNHWYISEITKEMDDRKSVTTK